MIRDPSDGTVREKPVGGLSPVIGTGTSGLPTDKLKAEEQARLERSRDWLKNRFQSRAEQSALGLRSTESGEG